VLEVDTHWVVHLLEAVHVFVNLGVMMSPVNMIDRPLKAFQLLYLLGQFHISRIMIDIKYRVLKG